MASRPYTTPRPRQHNAHVWAYVNFRYRQSKTQVWANECETISDKTIKAVNERMRKDVRNAALTSGGRGLGRFGKW
jgi:asparagine synthetase B (glutamine-hydrolysing)